MLEASDIGAPIAVHFDEELEEDLLLEEVLDVSACLGADALKGRTGFADDNTLLGVSLAVDDCRDTDDIFLFDEGLDFDFDGVRDFFVIVKEDLLADDLVDKESFGLVGELIFWEERRSFGQGLFDGIEELGDAELLLRGDGEDLGFGQLGMPELDESLEGVLGSKVYFIYYKEHARTCGCHAFDFLEEVGIAVGVILDLGYIEQHIGIDEGRTGELEHLALELVVRREDSRSIGIDHLEVLAVDDTHDTMAGGLRLRRDYREALPHQCVHKRGLAHIGITHNVDKSASMLT